MSQTGGPCRAANYLALLKVRALSSAGFANVPVISLNASGLGQKTTPGFRLTLPFVKIALMALNTGGSYPENSYIGSVRMKRSKEKLTGRRAHCIRHCR
jgi:predicted nucleotide-binding protein (sugar kinase/HSP70/actin superfamily)